MNTKPTVLGVKSSSRKLEESSMEYNRSTVPFSESKPCPMDLSLVIEFDQITNPESISLNGLATQHSEDYINVCTRDWSGSE